MSDTPTASKVPGGVADPVRAIQGLSAAELRAEIFIIERQLDAHVRNQIKIRNADAAKDRLVRLYADEERRIKAGFVVAKNS